jgi:hypothetical protein
MTTANPVLTRIIDTAKNKAADKDAAFQALALKIAKGDPGIDPDKVVKSLEFWGKSYEELDKEVERIEERIRLIELANQVPGLAARSDEIYATIASAETDHARRLDELGREFAAIVDPLSDEIKTVSVNLAAARRAQGLARSGCMDSALRQRLVVVEQRQRAANAALHPRGGPTATLSPEAVKDMAAHNYGPFTSCDSRIAMLAGKADEAIAFRNKREAELKAILAECEKERESILDEMSRTI